MKAAITGLLAFAASEEAMLLLTAPPEPGGGSARAWAAAPLVAHCAQFKQQQAERLRALIDDRQPPSFGEIDHQSEAVYAAYAVRSRAEALDESRRITADLLDVLWALPDDTLRAARVNGRMLWLQVIVRGFWHATGHIGDYYLAHGQPARAVALAAHGVATARYLSAPGPAVGMACYNLACAVARDGRPDESATALAEAIALNPDLAGHAARDPDLAGVAPG